MKVEWLLPADVLIPEGIAPIVGWWDERKKEGGDHESGGEWNDEGINEITLVDACLVLRTSYGYNASYFILNVPRVNCRRSAMRGVCCRSLLCTLLHSPSSRDAGKNSKRVIHAVLFFLENGWRTD